MFSKFNNPRFLGVYVSLLLLLPLVACICFSIVHANHEKQTLMCPTEYVDTCVKMFKMHNKGTIKKMVGFSTDVVTFEVVEPVNAVETKMKNDKF